MAAPSKEEVRMGLTRQQLLDRFSMEVIEPSRRRVREDPACYHRELRRLRDEARHYFWSRARRFPSPREALVMFARARMEQAGVDPAIVRSAVQESELPSSSNYAAAQWIVYPDLRSVESGRRRRGLLEELRARYGPAAAGRPRTDPPPSTGPSPGPEAPPTEEDQKAEAMVAYYAAQLREVEEEVRVLERLLAAKEVLRSNYRETRSKHEAQLRAARERARGEQAAREQAERVARERRDREARERAEREARERQAREKAERAHSERERRSRSRRGPSSPPWWATELGITPPFTYEKIKAAYRTRSMVTHPDRGGTNQAFARLKKAYDEACLRFATRP
jgi:hypothetical protein